MIMVLPQTKLSKTISLAVSTIFLTSCIGSSETNGSKRCNPEVYIGLELNSQQDVKLAKTFLHKTSKKADNNLFHIDILTGDDVAYIYSDSYNKKAVRDIIQEKLEKKESSDKALEKAFNRVKNLVIKSKTNEDLYAYIVSSGTSNENTIQQIKQIIDDFASNQTKSKKLHLYLIGLTDENRTLLVDNALKSLPNTKHSSSTFSEWKNHINYNNCLEIFK